MTANMSKADRIASDDLPLLNKAIERLKQGQALQARANQFLAAAQLDAEELHAKYGLDAQLGEMIAEDGTITRA